MKTQESDVRFSIDSEIANKYLQVVKNYEMEDEDNSEFNFNLTSEQLELVVKYINHHGLDNYPKEIPKPLPSRDFQIYVSEWDYNFISSLNEIQITNLMDAANYLYCNELLELIAGYICSIFIGHTLEELQEMYGITQDLTPEIEKTIQSENEQQMFKESKFEKFTTSHKQSQGSTQQIPQAQQQQQQSQQQQQNQPSTSQSQTKIK